MPWRKAWRRARESRFADSAASGSTTGRRGQGAIQSPASGCRCPKSTSRTSRRERNCGSASISRNSRKADELRCLAELSIAIVPPSHWIRCMNIARWIVAIIVFLLLLLLSLQNADLVTVRFYHWFSWQAPLIFLLLIAFAGGAVAGLLARLVRATRLKRQGMRLLREHALRHPKDARSADVA